MNSVEKKDGAHKKRLCKEFPSPTHLPNYPVPLPSFYEQSKRRNNERK